MAGAGGEGALETADVVVTDAIPAGLSLIGGVLGPNPSVSGSTVTWTLTGLAPGEAVSMGFVTTPPAGNGAMVANSASLTDGSTTVTTAPVVVQNDCNQAMAIQKAWDNVCAQPGDPITVTLTATNTGATPLTNVRIRDVVQSGLAVTGVNNGGAYSAPNITWIVGDLGVGQTTTLTWTATIGAAAGDTFHNVATMTADGVEPTTSNQVNGVVLECDDGDVCTTDSCDPYVGCVNTLTPNGNVEECDGVDNDCDGLTDADDVATSFGAPYPADGGLEMEPCDVQFGVCQGAITTPELCVNGVWQDCTVEIYEDHSGGTYSSTDENCNGLDEDCSGVADDDYVPTATSCGTGVCATTGLLQCVSGELVDDCTPLAPTSSTDTVCDGLDEDCDGATDEDYTSVVVACGEDECANVGTGDSWCVDGVEGDTCSEVWQNISTIGDDLCLTATANSGLGTSDLIVIFLVVQDATTGADAGSVRCWQDTTPTGTDPSFACDTELLAGQTVLKVYPELLCLPPEGGTP